jgi:hypothetical protein
VQVVVAFAYSVEDDPPGMGPSSNTMLLDGVNINISGLPASLFDFVSPLETVELKHWLGLWPLCDLAGFLFIFSSVNQAALQNSVVS